MLSETSSFTISSAHSTTFASTTTEAVTSGDTTTEETTVTESASASETTSAETTSIETTVTSVITSASSDITEAPTTTETTTTAAASTTAALKFRLIAQGGPGDNKPIKSGYQRSSAILFTDSSLGYTEASFTVDPVTGHLLLDNGLPICSLNSGDLEVCPSSLSPTESMVTCETPTGQQLQCSVPQKSCTFNAGTGLVCVPTGVMYDTTYTGTLAAGVYTVQLGPAGGKSGSAAMSLIIEYDS
ncbi:hypothetical protein IL306_015375 [Fusarium sp. DS 682]|nr:hypothetical protein IL306_015375 [Fusarium sp. DS 682]